MNEELKELKERITHLTDEQLLEMIAAPDDYRPEALEYAESELKKRGIDFSEATPQEALEPQNSDDQRTVRAGVCPDCGGRTRSGTLVAEKELTVVFGDFHEERFIKVQACTECGRLSLIVDFDTDVQQ